MMCSSFGQMLDSLPLPSNFPKVETFQIVSALYHDLSGFTRKARDDLKDVHVALGEVKFPNELPKCRLFDNGPYTGSHAIAPPGRRLLGIDVSTSNSMALVTYTRSRDDWMSSHFAQVPLFLCTLVKDGLLFLFDVVSD